MIECDSIGGEKVVANWRGRLVPSRQVQESQLFHRILQSQVKRSHMQGKCFFCSHWYVVVIEYHQTTPLNAGLCQPLCSSFEIEVRANAQVVMSCVDQMIISYIYKILFCTQIWLRIG